MKDDTKEVIASIIVILLSILMLFAMPVISFGLGFLSGWVLQITIGDIVANGLNTVFNTDRFTPEMIPLFCATMGMIGGFFKSKLINKNKKDED